jgi:hypothetical protein
MKMAGHIGRVGDPTLHRIFTHNGAPQALVGCLGMDDEREAPENLAVVGSGNSYPSEMNIIGRSMHEVIVTPVHGVASRDRRDSG